MLAFRVRRHGGDKLARGIGKALQLVDDKVEVVALGDFRDAVFAFKTCGRTVHVPRQFSLGKRWSPKLGYGIARRVELASRNQRWWL